MVEWLLAANSAWLGLALLDGDFTTVAKTTAAIVAEIGLTPLSASVIAFSASALKFAGLFVCLADGGSAGGMWLRMAGLGCGVFIWTTLGVGFLLNPQWVPTALPTLSLGLISLIVLVRAPALPGSRPR